MNVSRFPMDSWILDVSSELIQFLKSAESPYRDNLPKDIAYDS